MFNYTVDMDTFSERIKPQNSTVERRITAEQILQLCRILAEQSKNKPFELKTHKMNKNSSTEIQSEDITSSRSSEHDYCDRLVIDCDEQQQDHHSAMILGDHNATCLSSSATIQAKQSKKDILNKIRNQIFERKRQKLANIQRSTGGVWRPW